MTWRVEDFSLRGVVAPRRNALRARPGAGLLVLCHAAWLEFHGVPMAFLRLQVPQQRLMTSIAHQMLPQLSRLSARELATAGVVRS